MGRTGPSLDALTWPRRTARLVLRPATIEDTEAVHGYRSREDVTRYLSRGPLNRDQVAEWLGSSQEGRSPRGPLLRMAIELEGRVVGDCMVRLSPDDNGMWAGEIGYTIAPEHTGAGLATEVATELVRLCFTELHVALVTADVYAPHVASQRVLEKAGLRLVAEKAAGSEGDGRPRMDDKVYAVTSAEWAARRGAVAP